MRDDPASLADVRGFDIPASHRGRRGRAITVLKTRLGRELEPLLRVLLEPQVRFNTALAALLSTPGPDLARRASEVLRPLADPTQWSPSPLGPVLRGLRPLLAAQHRWNLELVRWLGDAGTSWPPGPALGGARLDTLEARCDVLSGEALPPVLRPGGPLWREMLRRQIAFNHACVRVLRRLTGCARPVLAMPSAEAYAAWCREREPGEQERAAAALAGLAHRPLISLLTPAYQTPPAVLRACIASVRAQSYPHWELCLVDDGSRDPEVRRIAEDLAREDPRIRFARLEPNGGIARATNAALALATGEYVGLLDHDDVLAPHALAEVVLHLAAHPDTDVLYSDEDKLDAEGRRFAPYFKPAPSPELLRAVNYVCHFLVVRASLLREVDGVRTGFEGAQDHELVLRLLERTPRFAHLPRVLYHWRVMPGSTALDSSAKPAASEAGRRAVAGHLRRLGEEARVDVRAPGLYRVRYALRGEPLVSLLLLPEDGTDWSDADVRALLARTAWPRLEVLRSTFRTPGEEEGAEDTRVRCLDVPGRPGPTALANHWAHAARGDVLVFLRPGGLPTGPDWLEELASQALRPEVGGVGPGLVDARGFLLGGALWLGAEGQRVPAFAGLPDGALTPLGGTHWTRDVSAVALDGLTLRRELFERLGGFDETRALAGADVALCLGLGAAGLRVLHLPQVRWMRADPGRAEVATGAPPPPFARDPFHSPHLSLEDGGTRLAGTGQGSS